MTNVAITIIGNDRPGLVSALASTVVDHGGNWLDSQLGRLAGQFAGVVLVDLPDERYDDFEVALHGACSSVGLQVMMQRTEQAQPTGRVLAMNLVGQDRPGIVALVAQTLADVGVTIDELSTSTSDTPWAGGVLFHADALIRTPDAVSAADVRSALEALADELMVDLELASSDE